MTRRERLERKVARREGWAASAQQDADRHFDAAGTIADNIPLGQPILVGHHSERHARRDAERIHAHMDKACEAHARAQKHAQAAAGLAAQLGKAIFTDDADAPDALRARIAEREAEAAHMTTVNAAWRKATKAHPEVPARLAALAAAGTISAAEAATLAHRIGLCPWLAARPYDTTNIRACIRRDQDRLVQVQQRQDRAARAAANGGVEVVVIDVEHNYVRVTFAEKPDREVLDALKSAGFRWGAGSWIGTADRLPEELKK